MSADEANSGSQNQNEVKAVQANEKLRANAKGRTGNAVLSSISAKGTRYAAPANVSTVGAVKTRSG